MQPDFCRFLKRGITRRERLVNEKDVPANLRADGEVEASAHARRVSACWEIHDVAEFCETCDAINSFHRLRSSKTLGDEAGLDTLPAGPSPAEHGLDTEQARWAGNAHGASIERLEPCDGSKKRRLARAIVTDECHGLAESYLEVNAVQCADSSRHSSADGTRAQRIPQPEGRCLVDAVGDTRVLDKDRQRNSLGARTVNHARTDALP